MADQRIKGLEVKLTITSATGVETSLGNVTSFEFESMMEVLSQGILGETSKRRDDIFNGVRGSMELQLSRSASFGVMEKIKLRAQRRGDPNEVWNAVGRYSFPNGETARAVVKNIFFGGQPVNTGSREDYVTLKMDFEAEDFTVITR